MYQKMIRKNQFSNYEGGCPSNLKIDFFESFSGTFYIRLFRRGEVYDEECPVRRNVWTYITAIDMFCDLQDSSTPGE